MTTTLHMTDVPFVPAAALARAMRCMIDDGKGLVLLRGLAAEDMQALEAAIWDRLEGTLAERRAVLVRFQALADVFASRRLREMMLRHGFPLLAPAMQVAARLRLNAERGFSPFTFHCALQALLAGMRAHRPAAAERDLHLAA